MLRLSTLVVVFGLVPELVSGQAKSSPAAAPLEQPAAFKGLSYRLVGPYWGGRVSRVAGVPGDPTIYYAATASGGVWKTTDAGLTWKPIFDDQPTSLHRLHRGRAVRPERGLRRHRARRTSAATSRPAPASSSRTDAGKTWKHVWKSRTGRSAPWSSIRPNADVAFAAVLGHAFGPNSERGVYRTKDGGKTWERVLFKNDETGASDVCIDPRNPRVIFAGFWQARRAVGHDQRRPGQRPSAPRDGGDYLETRRSSPAERRLPEGRRIWGKVGVAVAPSDAAAGLRPDRGREGRPVPLRRRRRDLATGQRSQPVRQRAWYYSTLTVHPHNPDVVCVPQRAACEEHRRREDASPRRAACTTATTTTSGSTRRTPTG